MATPKANCRRLAQVKKDIDADEAEKAGEALTQLNEDAKALLAAMISPKKKLTEKGRLAAQKVLEESNIEGNKIAEARNLRK